MNTAVLRDATMQCPACGRISRVNSENIGRKLKCRCGNVAVAREDSQIEASVAANATPKPNGPSQNGSSKSRKPTPNDLRAIESLRSAYEQMTSQLSEVIVGQHDVVEQVLISVFSRGHVLLTGVPGLAKTLLIDSVAKVLDLQFRRIQFTPDLMPADITGTEVLQEDRTTGTRNFQFVRGPIFSNMVLADEINRAPPKTQAALLEAMQERHVSIAGQTMPLPAPFFVMATQNPIEQEGTYPLPEAQLDRFLFNIVVDYPDAEDEFQIIRRATSRQESRLEKVLNAEQILQLQQTVQTVPAADHVIGYARDLVQATRPAGPDSPNFVREMVSWGAGPRAGIALVMSAKARAILHGRLHVTTADISAVAAPVLRHRIATTFHAESAGVTRDDLVRMLLEEIRPQRPRSSNS
ncbi:MAG: MoxR family ATPase [Planctomycetaceae bacterium]